MSIQSNNREEFVTTTRRLNRNIPPMRLFEKAKKFGIWNPSDIDFTQDKEDWKKLSADEKSMVLHLTSLFVAGEEAVTLDLLPLIMAIAKEGRIEEEMFLTTFLWEEAKHTDFFQRFLNEVLEIDGDDLTSFHSENYSHIFYEALPPTMLIIRCSKIATLCLAISKVSRNSSKTNRAILPTGFS